MVMAVPVMKRDPSPASIMKVASRDEASISRRRGKPWIWRWSAKLASRERGRLRTTLASPEREVKGAAAVGSASSLIFRGDSFVGDAAVARKIGDVDRGGEALREADEIARVVMYRARRKYNPVHSLHTGRHL